ncbi:MAG: hypothetical protein AMS27_12815 [Bacteroides sp. SM23_62_1]|nr:MAG: hypothetical protein AMS27_12815 [Bacteroides sp. SM23_62_1]
MKSFNDRLIQILPLFILFLLIFNQCNVDNTSLYNRIRDHADQVNVIDAHEHQHWPEEYGDHQFTFYNLLAASYLSADVYSAGAAGFDWYAMDTLSMDTLWAMYGEALDNTRGTSYYSHFVKGFQKLYGFSDLYFTGENLAALSPQIEENYKDYRTWFDEAFHQAGFELMFLDQYWKPFNTEIDERYFALVFHINPLVSASSRKPEKGSEPNQFYKEARAAGYEINDLDDYLAFCDHLFKKNIENRAVCLKNSQAYSRTLLYENVSYDEASNLFEKPSSRLTPAEAKKIEDFIFHWIIKKSIEYDLPIQIHTGYLAGNGNMLDNGKPVKLNNLFLLYPEAKFILFHGGYPWTGEYAALGKMFRNVYLDIVWLPQISREEAVHALDEMFDCVPYNKFFWGGDCGFIEESTGSLEYGKDVVAEVLSKRIERGLLTEDVALDIINKIFRENAIEVFQLEEKLGRSF